MKLKLLPVLTLSVFLLSIFSLVLTPNAVKSATSNHLVISEIQVSGGAGDLADNDFVELYNPTDTAVDLSDMRLVKRTSTGDSDQNIVVFVSGDEVAPHSYFLWCNSSLNESLSCDKSTSQTISNHNSIALRVDPADTGEIVDAVTFGEPDFTLGEGESLTEPEGGQSMERKACSEGEGTGNAEDSDDNANDFVVRSTPLPQNSSSEAVVPNCTSPSPTSSPTPTPIASATPSATPTPTSTPTSQPTQTATPTSTPTPIATTTPSPSPSVSASPMPSPTESPTPVFSFRLDCRVKFRVFGGRFFTIIMPQLVCERVTLN